MNREWYVFLRDKFNLEDPGRYVLVEAVSAEKAQEIAAKEYVNCEILTVSPVIEMDSIVRVPQMPIRPAPSLSFHEPKQVAKPTAKVRKQAVTEQKEQPDSSLFFCAQCGKTFRSEVGKCPICQAQVEAVVKFLDKEESKQEQPQVVGNTQVQVVGESVAVKEEQEQRKIIAKGIEDKADAEKIAAAKKGKVVTDEDDPKKFMVITEAYDLQEGYLAQCKVSVLNAPETEDFESVKNVDVRYDLELEYRSWGIKDFSVRFLEPISIFTTTGDIQVDVENIEIEWLEGSGIYPYQVTYDYKTKRAVVSFYYWKPN